VSVPPGDDFMRPEGWAEGQCWIIGCTAPVGVWFNGANIKPSLMPSLFGLPPAPRSYAEWERYPAFVGTCQRHWRAMRNKHGTELGYRMRDGKTERFVKDYYF